MGTGANIGATLFALGELNVMDRKIAHAQMEAASGKILANQEIVDKHNKYVFAAKSHVHGLRAKDRAHIVTEDQLIAALKAENANHPLASREAVDAAVMDERARQLLNPEVIKRTYPDGKLPEGAVIPPDKSLLIA